MNGAPYLIQLQRVEMMMVYRGGMDLKVFKLMIDFSAGLNIPRLPKYTGRTITFLTACEFG